MIYEFLCLVGPGVLSLFVYKRILQVRWKETSIVLSVCAAIAYAMINIAIIIFLLEPYGSVQITACTDGMPTVHYGSIALLISVVIAVLLGILGAIFSGSVCHIMIPQTLPQWGKTVSYFTAALLAMGALMLRIGSPDGQMRMRVSTMPVKINSVVYQSQTPMYYSDTEQDYFFSAEELAKGLGIAYEKEPGFFREKYRLGDSSFSVSRIFPGKDFYKKEGRLFLSFSYLTDTNGPIGDIHIHSSPVLADGNSRESIYIDNYPQRFTYQWTANEYISHALGGIKDQVYTNSLEAFRENYKKGHRVFEVDLQMSADNVLVAAHELPLTDKGKLMTAKQFKKSKIRGKYTPLLFRDIVRLMVKYPDIYLVTDTKETQPQNIKKQFAYIVETAKEIEPQVLTRIVPQIYNEEMFDIIMKLYNWDSMIYTLYALSDFSEKEVVDFAYREGIQVITTNTAKAQPLFLHELFERDLMVYMHTYNSLTEVAAQSGGVKGLGVHGVYTDFLYPGCAAEQ